MKDAFIGRHLLGRYRISKLIGRGGMSMVYLAEQQIGGVARPVAIKILDQHSTTDPQIVERFRRESETVVRLRHPNTVEIYDTGELDDGTMFFVMEYIEGESLSSVIRKGAVSVERGDRILLQIGSSLYDAHQMGIVHRDLKPANVIVTTRGLQRDFVKVLDFGLAKTNWDGERLTGSDRLLGTPAYMSPEQFTHAEVDVRSDVYALGVVAYQIMSGRLPFQAKGPWEWATKHLNDSPEPLGTLPNGEKLHPRKASAIMRALSKKPEERQQTVLEFLRDYTGYKDIGDAWAQATAGAGSAPPSSIAPPSMPPRLEFGTLDTDGKRAVAGLPAGLSGRPHVPVAPPAAPGAATPQSGDPGRVRARTILGMFPPASAGNSNAPNVPPPPPVARVSAPPVPPPPPPGPKAAAPPPPPPAARPAPPTPRARPLTADSLGELQLPMESRPPRPDPAASSPTTAIDGFLSPSQSIGAVADLGPSLGREPPGVSLDGAGAGAGHSLLHPQELSASVGRRGGHENIAWNDDGRPGIELATDGVARPSRRPTAPNARAAAGTSTAMRAVKWLASVLLLVGVGFVGWRAYRNAQEAPDAAVEPGTAGQEALPAEGLERARKELRDGDVERAVTFVETAMRSGTYKEMELAGIRAELSPSGGDEVERLIRRGRCEEAQSLYVRLANVGAGAGAREKFTARCVRP